MLSAKSSLLIFELRKKVCDLYEGLRSVFYSGRVLIALQGQGCGVIGFLLINILFINFVLLN